jgi:hypothetical protein
VTVDADSATGAVVSYDLPAVTSVIDGTITPSCDPAPGSTFPVGNTVVHCSATDSLGVTKTKSFHVVVNAPPVSLAASAPATANAGVAFVVKVHGVRADGSSALDAGPFTISDSTGTAVLGDTTCSGSVCSLTVTVSDPSTSDVVVVHDAGAFGGTLTAFTQPIAVAAEATHFVVTKPAPGVAPANTGVFTFHVTALDAAGNVVTSYAGPVTYEDAGPGTVTVLSETWSNGKSTTTVSISAPDATDTITATDAGDPSINGTSNPFKVTP